MREGGEERQVLLLWGGGRNAEIFVPAIKIVSIWLAVPRGSRLLHCQMGQENEGTHRVVQAKQRIWVGLENEQRRKDRYQGKR